DVDVQQGEIVLKAGFVEVSIVDADSDPSILLFHWHNVCYPLRIVPDFEESRVDLLDDFFLDAEEKTSPLWSQLLALGWEFLSVEWKEVLDY
ncbi:hypothetical protein CRG98_032850, partial [Punica granatum]